MLHIQFVWYLHHPLILHSKLPNWLNILLSRCSPITPSITPNYKNPSPILAHDSGLWMYLYGFIQCCTMCSLRKYWHSKSLTQVTAWTQLPHTSPWWKHVGAQSVHTPIRTSGWVDEKGGGGSIYLFWKKGSTATRRKRMQERGEKYGGEGHGNKYRSFKWKWHSSYCPCSCEWEVDEGNRALNLRYSALESIMRNTREENDLAILECSTLYTAPDRTVAVSQCSLKCTELLLHIAYRYTLICICCMQLLLKYLPYILIYFIHLYTYKYLPNNNFPLRDK